MTPNGAVLEAAGTAAPQGARLRLAGLMTRRIWLPRRLYAAIPWIYLGLGATALFGGLYLPDGAWIYPYLALLGVACLHAGLSVASLRHRSRSAAGPVPGGGGWCDNRDPMCGALQATS